MCSEKTLVRVEQHVTLTTEDEFEQWKSALQEQFLDLARAKTGKDATLVAGSCGFRAELSDVAAFGSVPAWYRRAVAKVHPLQLTLSFTKQRRDDGTLECCAVIAEHD